MFLSCSLTHSSLEHRLVVAVFTGAPIGSRGLSWFLHTELRCSRASQVQAWCQQNQAPWYVTPASRLRSASSHLLVVLCSDWAPTAIRRSLLLAWCDVLELAARRPTRHWTLRDAFMQYLIGDVFIFIILIVHSVHKRLLWECVL